MSDTIGFIVWIVQSIIIEAVIALIFRYGNKKQLASIAIINLATLLPLSILLYAMMQDIRQKATGGDPGHGMGLIAVFVIGGILACVIKIVMYTIWLNAFAKQPRKRSMGIFLSLIYSIVANAASFAAAVNLVEMDILL